MDGQPSRQHGHQDGYQRGGRSGGGHARKTTTQVYRRVESTTTATPPAEPPPAPASPKATTPFKSSLMASIAKSPPRLADDDDTRRNPRNGAAKSPVKQAASPARSTGRGGGSGRGDRGSSPKLTPMAGSSLAAASLADSGRRVTMTTRRERSGSIESTSSTNSSRWVRKGTNHDGGDDRHNRSSVTRSSSGQDARSSNGDTRRSAGNGRSYGRAESYDDRTSQSRGDYGNGGRRVELTQENLGRRSFSRRKNSFESDTSEVSVRSTTSTRSTRSNMSRSSRYDNGSSRYGSHRSIDDGRRGGDRLSLSSRLGDDRAGPPRRFERSVSDASAPAAPPPTPVTPLRGSSLAKSAQDARTSTPPPAFKSSLAASLQKSSGDVAPVPFKSSLSASATAFQQPAPATQEQQPKRLVDRLRERQGETASPLTTDRALAAGYGNRFDRGSIHADMPSRDFRPAPGSTIMSRVGDRQTSDKENRSREFYARLDSADSQREAARRAAAPFQSSLRSSLARREGNAKVVLDKKSYSIDDLRKLRPTANVARPADLRDMTLGEVIEVRVPTRPAPGSKSSRRVEVTTRERGSRARGGGAGKSGSGRDGRSKKEPQRSGGRRGGPPPPPVYDGPVEPLQLSENRWVPKKTALSPLETTLSHVKSVLNKLTREKFAKLTDELCNTDITSLEMLQSIITIIMEKAIEEPSFADVYADLCKQFHIRTSKKPWKFIRPVPSKDKPGMYAWTAIRCEAVPGFFGPFHSVEDCFVSARTGNAESKESSEQNMSNATMYIEANTLIAIVESTAGAFFYKKTSIESLPISEPVVGEWASEEDALKAAHKQTNFRKLLVTGCQDEFQNPQVKSTGTEAESAELDQRQKEQLATKAKRRMLGNIRFIGELFKVDLLQQGVVQECVLHLLGLQLVANPSDGQLAGQEVQFPDEEDLEALCKLLATVGKKYDQPQIETVMRIIILRLVELSDDKKLPSRTRFLLKDVLEMRDHLWEPRRKELQQKTLEEVRREAMQLQSQGKNAQHDNVAQRRLKSQVSSVQLAKESSNLLVRKESLPQSTSNPSSPPTSPTGGNATAMDPAKLSARIKGIVQEYTLNHDIEEAIACVHELPSLVEFAEEIANRVLEGKEQERADAVELIVKLYSRGAIDATSIQLALVNVLEFLDDFKIDIPLVHEYSAVLLGRLITAGCFGLSWMVTKALVPVMDSGLASLVFAEVLPVIAAESDARLVARMIADDELSPASVLPPKQRRDESASSKFIQDHHLEVYFGGELPEDDDDNDDTLDPEIESKMRSTLEEYLSVHELDEVVNCVKEYGGDEGSIAFMWRHFMRVCIQHALDAKPAVRGEVAALIHLLITKRPEDVHIDDAEWGFEAALDDYEDVRVDVPRLADNFADLWTPLFAKDDGLTLQWLHEATEHLETPGTRAEILNALLTKFDSEPGREKLCKWWTQQPGNWFVSFSSGSGDVDQRLTKWQSILTPP